MALTVIQHPLAAHVLTHLRDQTTKPALFRTLCHQVTLLLAPAGKALQDAAGEPKKITWYDSDHVGIDLEHTKRVLTDGLRWLLEQDDPLRPPEERTTNVPPFEINRT